MKTSSSINRVKDGIYAQCSSNLATLAEVRKSSVAELKKAGVDRGLAILSELLGSINSIVNAPVIEDLKLPECISKVETTDTDKFTQFTLSIRSKLKAPIKFRQDTVIAVDDNVIENISKAFISALFEMFYNEVATANVAELNAKIEEICAQEEIPCMFSFQVADTDAIVLSISDSKVVFNASITKALSISDLGIFQSGDAYNELICREATARLVDSLKASTTTTQLIKGGVDLIKEVTGVSTKKRASKLIRASYHRKAQYLDAVKTGVGYFEDTVKIGKEDVKVFALVEKAEDGTLAVVLSPFDEATYMTVDFDVLKALKKVSK